jgi:hypothetical protein
LTVWERPGAEITTDATGRHCTRDFEGPLAQFTIEPHLSRFAVGRTWDEGDDYDGFETVSAVLRRGVGGMAVLSLELADDGALAGNASIEELPQAEEEITPGNSRRGTRFYVGPTSLIEADTWMEPGSSVADRAGFTVERKTTKQISAARSSASIGITNAAAATAEATGIGVGEVELDWVRGEVKIHRHPEFAELTITQLEEVEDYVAGSRVLWDDVEYDAGDSTAVQLQKKLARLRVANRNTFVRNLPVIRQTIQLPEPPFTGYGDEQVLKSFDAGITNTPPLRVLRDDGTEYYWVLESNRLSRADSGRWQRRIEWQGHIEVPLLEAESIEEAIL